MLKQKSFGVCTIVWLIVIVVSLFAGISILCDLQRPEYYGTLFILPLSFGVFSLVFAHLYFNMSENIGMSVILILFFVRMVISPMLMCFGGYAVTITRNIDQNTPRAIFLLIYETFAVFLTLYYLNQKKSNRVDVSVQNNKKISNKYTSLILIAVVLFYVCLRITPQIMDMYRTVFEISDEFFTNYEDSYVVSKYATSFLKKLSLVTGTYLSRALLLLIPSYFIIKLSYKKTILRQTLAFLLCFFPIFFIGGAIARSLIYIVCLMLLYNYMFEPEKKNTKAFIVLFVGAVTVVAWWIFNSDGDGLSSLFSKRFSAYFSGVNVVSGVFNLPYSLKYRVRYFLYDFTSTMPYGTTIFGISEKTVQPFFNAYNQSWGQIPPTIGMGYYYFGTFLSPIYSIVFTTIAFKAGVVLNNNTYKNPMSYIRYLLTVFQFSMGIVMYNIEITMTSFFSVILPMYLMEKFTDKKER